MYVCILVCLNVCMYISVYVHMYVYTHNGILFSHKKEQNFATCSSMDELGGYYAKVK